MSESIPLRAALSVECVCVVIDNIFDHSLDMMVKSLTIKCRFLWNIEGKTINELDIAFHVPGYIEYLLQSNHLPGCNLPSRSHNPFLCQEIQSPQLSQPVSSTQAINLGNNIHT